MTAWLLTWLWQGVALAVSLSITLHMLPRVNAATRYLLWWCAFAALIVLGWQTSPQLMNYSAIAGNGGQGDPTLFLQVRPLPAWALSLIGMVWASVALFHLIGILPSLSALYRLKDACRPFPSSVEEQLPLWLDSRGRHVRLALCDRLPGAALLGLHDPCIALPSSLVSELNAEDLDQVILHEYGHAQRRDDWMRLVQTLLEAALWIHPASFLIGRELNLEREVACDDWVIARTRSPKRYAACLSRVAERGRAPATDAFTEALFGGHRALVRRVDRLLNSRRNAARKPSLQAAAIGAFVIAAFALELRALPLVTDAVSSDAAPAVASSFAQPVEVVSVDVGRELGSPNREATKSNRTDLAVRSRTGAVISTVRLMQTASGVTGDAPNRADSGGIETGGSAEAAVEEISVLRPARVFEGVYHAPPAAKSAEPSAPGVTPWQLAADAGVGIGAATRDAGVGLAGAFTNAGSAIARSFH